MKLRFKQKHLSISEFNETELPNFTVLTGVNGSGKSQLLEAIELRKVLIQDADAATIVRFNYETFRLENENTYNGQQIAAEKDDAWNFFQAQVKSQVAGFRTKLGATYQTLVDTCRTKKKPLWNSGEQINPYRQNLKGYFSQDHLKQHQSGQAIYSLAKKLPYSLDEINQDDFMELYKPYNYKNDFLPQALGKVIWDYYIKYRNNQVNEFENEKNGKNYPVLSEEDFILTHGEKPWEVINKILERFDTLDYRVNSPEGTDYFRNFQLKLKHTKIAGLEIDFSSLSSGERVLMALVASVYKASSDNHFPDVLLLDELDASLHPSMIKNLLTVIKDIFLDKGIKVILVTHSPTTIALAPDDAIFVMNKMGLSRIEKRSKQQALSILTEGFATLGEGIMLFDETVQNQFSIITEGRNANLIEKACELYGRSDVKVIAGFEGNSGKDQLKTLFDFFSRASHKNAVVFIWDCDVGFNLKEDNNTYPFILSKNEQNSIATKGIENMFPEELFDGFKRTITDSRGVKTEFDGSLKKKFEEFILNRSNKADFANFSSLFAKLDSIKASADGVIPNPYASDKKAS